jgi:hypothetical protein
MFVIENNPFYKWLSTTIVFEIFVYFFTWCV